MNVRELPIDLIVVKSNIRLEADDELGELMNSIERHDLLQPIIVYRRGDRYELVCGHRRLAAMKLRGEPMIAARILDGVSEHEIPLIKLQENVQRKQLTSEEIVRAADEIRRQRPKLTDHDVERLIGKREGYLSLHRSTMRGGAFLAQQGIPSELIRGLTGEEVREMCAKLRAGDGRRQTRQHTYHRGDRLPAVGFRLVIGGGPGIMVVCASPSVRSRVIRELKKLQKEVS